MSSDLMRSDGSRSTRPNGFSLVECLVVVALLGILASLAIPSSSAVQRRLELDSGCLLYTSPSPRDVEESRMPSSA